MQAFAWFGHVLRHDFLSKIVLHGTVESGRRRGGQRKLWIENIREWKRKDFSTFISLVRTEKNGDPFVLMSPL